MASTTNRFQFDLMEHFPKFVTLPFKAFFFASALLYVSVVIAKEQEPLHNLDLRCATLIGESSTTLALTAINNDKNPIRVFPVGTVPNHLVVTSPDGSTTELSVLVDNEIDQVEIPAGSQYKWLVVVSNKLGLYNIFQKQKGLYRATWVIDQGGGMSYRSNEVLLLNE